MPLILLHADPNSDVDYSVQWAGENDDCPSFLQAGEKIASSQWLVTSGDETLVSFGASGVQDLTGADSNGDPVVVHEAAVAYSWIAFDDAAREGDEFVITNRVETDNVPPRKQDQSFRLVLRHN